MDCAMKRSIELLVLNRKVFPQFDGTFICLVIECSSDLGALLNKKVK